MQTLDQVGAVHFPESGTNTLFSRNDFGASDTLIPKSAPPSVKVHGGISGEGAAICGIQASEAAHGFRGISIRSGELGELQRSYAWGFSTELEADRTKLISPVWVTLLLIWVLYNMRQHEADMG